MSKNPYYENMIFPEYEFREFPKWVTPEGGKPVLVHSADEESEVMDTGEAPYREADEIKRLLAIAAVKDVTVDKRWGVAKLMAAITNAGHDASFDPTV